MPTRRDRRHHFDVQLDSLEDVLRECLGDPRHADNAQRQASWSAGVLQVSTARTVFARLKQRKTITPVEAADIAAEVAGHYGSALVSTLAPAAHNDSDRYDMTQKGGDATREKYRPVSPRDRKLRRAAAKLPSALTTTAKAILIKKDLRLKLSVRRIRHIISDHTKK